MAEGVARFRVLGPPSEGFPKNRLRFIGIGLPTGRWMHQRVGPMEAIFPLGLRKDEPGPGWSRGEKRGEGDDAEDGEGSAPKPALAPVRGRKRIGFRRRPEENTGGQQEINGGVKGEIEKAKYRGR